MVYIYCAITTVKRVYSDDDDGDDEVDDVDDEDDDIIPGERKGES